MSADRDRGIRRIKQKRAKDAKKLRRLHGDAVAARAAPLPTPAPKAG